MIYIDASRYNSTDKKTGVENYSFFLINELAKQTPNKITLIAPKKIPLQVKQIIIPFPRLWTQLRLSWEILKNSYIRNANKKINNLFVPSHMIPLIHPKNTTITIHDVAFKRFPESYSVFSRWYLDWGTKFAVKHAKNIITPSETTKKDLINFYNAKKERITVIPLGYKPAYKNVLSDKYCETILEKYNLKIRGYFLFLGRIENKKNVKTLVKAFNGIKNIHPYIKLVLAGKNGVGSEEILQNIKNDNIILTGYIKDCEKQILLKNCLCFVFPSLFEGFGLPLLEAMDANVPIIASNIPTSYEIAKDNAMFFKTESTDELTAKLKDIVEKKGLHTELVKNHKKTLKKYSWKKCAEKTLKIIK